jgi:molybdenum cofactor cytidylyltransferase
VIEIDQQSLYALVLAAGGSSRFGSPKQVAQFQGQSLIARAVALANAVVGPTFRVVLGAHAADIASRLQLTVGQQVVNPSWADGIAGSIRCGIESLPENCTGALILLADQPQITAASLGRLISAWRAEPDRIVASRFGSVTGAPCLFPRSSFSQLAALRGDQGARRLLDALSADVRAIRHPEAAIDIDTPQQLLDLQNRS